MQRAYAIICALLIAIRYDVYSQWRNGGAWWDTGVWGENNENDVVNCKYIGSN